MLKLRIAHFLVRIAERLGYKQQAAPLVPIPVVTCEVEKVVAPPLWASADPYMNDAALFVEQFDTLDGSGEAKCHQVYALLIKKFPTASRRALRMAIERAVDALPRT